MLSVEGEINLVDGWPLQHMRPTIQLPSNSDTGTIENEDARNHNYDARGEDDSTSIQKGNAMRENDSNDSTSIQKSNAMRENERFDSQEEPRQQMEDDMWGDDGPPPAQAPKRPQVLSRGTGGRTPKARRSAKSKGGQPLPFPMFHVSPSELGKRPASSTQAPQQVKWVPFQAVGDGAYLQAIQVPSLHVGFYSMSLSQALTPLSSRSPLLSTPRGDEGASKTQRST